MTPLPIGQPDESAEQRFRFIALSCLQALDEAMAVFLETEDPAGPHKARVALRRLTTALDAFAPVLRRRVTADLRARAKRLFRDLGPVRDSDVQLMQARPLPRGMAEQNRALRDKTRARLRKTRAVGFTASIRALLHAEDALFRRSSKARDRRDAPAQALAGGMLAAAWATCAAHGPSILLIPALRLHDFRKDMKSLRYLAEFFADAFPALAQDPWAGAFRDIQNGLGAWNDLAVARAAEGRPLPAPQPARPSDRLPDSVAAALRLADTRWRDLCTLTPPWTGAAS